MQIKVARGTKDVLPSDIYKWYYVENKFKDVCKRFGYKELRTPIFEHTELFKRGVGETTDIVQKEMYTFKDNGDRSLTLKPEGTAPVVRSFIENKMYADAQPTKIFYITPCFRYERPQAGRYRAFHQFGVEAFGAKGAGTDAEVISLAMLFFKELGLQHLELRINSIGCPTCRKEYNDKLKNYLETKLDKLCGTCNDRFDKNPMRIIDCKNQSCQAELTDIPLMIDSICDDCKDHFAKVKDYLTSMGIDYIVDPKIVRGLDYYNKTAFEIISKEIGTQATVCGGGRYDGLISELGGPETPGVGFGLGIERLLLTLENNNIEIPKPPNADIFIVTMGEIARNKAIELCYKLRNAGFIVDTDHLERSVKAQFKYSNKIGSKYTIVIGEDELKNNKVTLKDMSASEQREVSIDKIVEELLDIV